VFYVSLLPKLMYTGNNHFTPSKDAKYCDEHICMSVCPLAYFKNHMSRLHKIFCTLAVAMVWSFS